MLSRLVVGHTPICECHVAAITKALQKAFCSLNISSKPVALVSAALLTLDFASTSVVSAATASTYLAGEVALPFPDWVGTAIVFLLFVCISLSGLRDSARIALSVLSFHVCLLEYHKHQPNFSYFQALTMLVLIIFAVVHWGRIGNGQIQENWHIGLARHGSSAEILKQIYYGFSLGMLGLTGFECMLHIASVTSNNSCTWFPGCPAYVARIRDNQFPKVLRNLHLPAIALNSIIMVLVLAVVPLDVMLSGANVLSTLGLMVKPIELSILCA